MSLSVINSILATQMLHRSLDRLNKHDRRYPSLLDKISHTSSYTPLITFSEWTQTPSCWQLTVHVNRTVDKVLSAFIDHDENKLHVSLQCSYLGNQCATTTFKRFDLHDEVLYYDIRIQGLNIVVLAYTQMPNEYEPTENHVVPHKTNFLCRLIKYLFPCKTKDDSMHTPLIEMK